MPASATEVVACATDVTASIKLLRDSFPASHVQSHLDNDMKTKIILLLHGLFFVGFIGPEKNETYGLFKTMFLIASDF